MQKDVLHLFAFKMRKGGLLLIHNCSEVGVLNEKMCKKFKRTLLFLIQFNTIIVILFSIQFYEFVFFRKNLEKSLTRFSTISF